MNKSMLWSMMVVLMMGVGSSSGSREVDSGTALDDNSFDEKTKGLSVFIKFYAPWCGHSRDLEPEWDVLQLHFAKNKTLLIGEVDCDDKQSKKICSYYGVKAFPSIFYGQPQDMKRYRGPLTYSRMRDFVEANVYPLCSPEYITFCTDAQAKAIQEFSGYAGEALEAAIQEEEGKIKAAQDEFREKVEEMKRMYSTWSAERDEAVQKIKSGKLALLKAVRATGMAQRSVILEEQAGGNEEVDKERSAPEEAPVVQEEEQPFDEPAEPLRKETHGAKVKEDDHDEGARPGNVADL